MDNNKQKVSKAMKAFLQRAQEHDQFMKTQQIEYEIGKRHLANMMGKDRETFTQKVVDDAIFPSGIYDKFARPAMKSPDQVFPALKAAEFDETGRPFHSMFYSGRPNFFKLLYDIVEEINKLNDLEERMLRRGTKADADQKVRLNDGSSGQTGAIRWGIAMSLRSFVDQNMIEEMQLACLLPGTTVAVRERSLAKKALAKSTPRRRGKKNYAFFHIKYC